MRAIKRAWLVGLVWMAVTSKRERRALATLKNVIGVGIVAALALGGAGPSQAASILAFSEGSYCFSGVSYQFCTGDAGLATGNYLTGESGLNLFRSFFEFDLTGVTGPVTSAELFFNLSFPDYPGFVSSDPTETLSFFSVDSTSASALSSGGAGASGFADLGAGTIYASFTAPPGGLTTLTVPFNAAGLLAINSSLGSTLLLGGAVTTAFGPNDQFIFGGSINRTARLNLSTAAVPEPATLSLLALGLAGLGFSRQRKPN